MAKFASQESQLFYRQFNSSRCLFMYGNDRMATKKIDAFKQGKGKTDHFEHSVDAHDLRLWKSFRKAVSNATAELKISLSTAVRYELWGMKSKHHKIHVEGRANIGSHGKTINKNKFKLKRSSKKWRYNT